jgi:RNA polymerase sigma factor (sigma-70 family)
LVTKPDRQLAFEQLLQRNGGRLAAIARAYAWSEAEDLLQEILLQLWRSLDGFEQRASVDTWCYRVALNTAISWRRAAMRRRANLPADVADIDHLPGAVDGSDPVELLQRFLQTLGDADRALVLMYLDGMSGAEMADVMGIRETAVRVRIHRIKARLAEWNASDR